MENITVRQLPGSGANVSSSSPGISVSRYTGAEAAGPRQFWMIDWSLVVSFWFFFSLLDRWMIGRLGCESSTITNYYASGLWTYKKVNDWNSLVSSSQDTWMIDCSLVGNVSPRHLWMVDVRWFWAPTAIGAMDCCKLLSQIGCRRSAAVNDNLQLWMIILSCKW